MPMWKLNQEMINFQLKEYQEEKVEELITICQTELDKAERNNETRQCLLEAPNRTYPAGWP